MKLKRKRSSTSRTTSLQITTRTTLSPSNYVQNTVQSKTHSHPLEYHAFTDSEVTSIQTQLLAWFDQDHRVMPWRKPFESSLTDFERAQRAYEVWVSEIMLQQTQVSTVIKYYERWMALWPTVHDLANTDIEKVNQVWAGLGYYSRARRLWESAKVVVNDYAGSLPSDPHLLQKSIGGIGPYTAGAICSIAYNIPTPLVDGNVLRVLSRLRAVFADMKAKDIIDGFWSLASRLVPLDRPGDFNQSLMELGATVCTPQNPNCKFCPIKQDCLAYKEVISVEKSKQGTFFTTKRKPQQQESDIEECQLCLPFNPTASSHNVKIYPMKVPKKKSREEACLVCILECVHNEFDSFYLIVRRPDTGLLAGLWEFPSIELGKQVTFSVKERQDLSTECLSSLNITLPTQLQRTEKGSIKHIFSHIDKTYYLESVRYSGLRPSLEEFIVNSKRCRWIVKDDITSGRIPISTAMLKCWRAIGKDSI